MSASLAGISAVSFMSLGVLLSARQLPRLWHHRSDFWDHKPTGIPYSHAAWRGWVRAIPAGCVGAGALVAAGWIVVLLPRSPGSKAALALASTVLALAIAGMASIVLFNWPKRLVPPHLRNEPGLFRLTRP
jgi:hypothetical protein